MSCKNRMDELDGGAGPTRIHNYRFLQRPPNLESNSNPFLRIEATEEVGRPGNRLNSKQENLKIRIRNQGIVGIIVIRG